MASGLRRPSWAQGVARHASVSAYPSLWNNLQVALVPNLGPTGATLHDASGHRRDGTLETFDLSTAWNFPQQNPRLPGYSLKFDGSSDIVSFKLPLSSGEPFTVHIWMITSVTQTRYLISLGAAATNQGPHLATLSSGLWRFAIWGDGIIDTAATYNTNQWYLFVATYDGTNGRIYIDGKLEAGPSAMTFTGTDGNADIGELNNGTGQWPGSLDGLLIWNRALNDKDVITLYNRPIAPLILRPRLVVQAAAAAVTIPDQTLAPTQSQTESGGMVGQMWMRRRDRIYVPLQLGL